MMCSGAVPAAAAITALFLLFLFPLVACRPQDMRKEQIMSYYPYICGKPLPSSFLLLATTKLFLAVANI